MVLGSDTGLAIQVPMVADGAPSQSVRAQTLVSGRLRERIRVYARLQRQLTRDAEDCRDRGRWTKAAQLEGEAEFYRSQLAIFRDALSKARADEGTRDDAAPAHPDQLTARPRDILLCAEPGSEDRF